MNPTEPVKSLIGCDIILYHIMSLRIREHISPGYSKLFNPKMYGIVTQDILARKLYPIVLDKKSVDARANY